MEDIYPGRVGDIGQRYVYRIGGGPNEYRWHLAPPEPPLFATPGERPMLVRLRPLFKNEGGCWLGITSDSDAQFTDTSFLSVQPATDDWAFAWVYPAMGFRWASRQTPNARHVGVVAGRDVFIVCAE